MKSFAQALFAGWGASGMVVSLVGECIWEMYFKATVRDHLESGYSPSRRVPCLLRQKRYVLGFDSIENSTPYLNSVFGKCHTVTP